MYSKIARPGVIDHLKKGTVTIGELSGEETPELLGISELFHSSGVECTVSKNIRRAKWEKMCWNCVCNPLTVVLHDHVARALDRPPMQQVIAAIVREVVAIAACEGVVLPEGMPERVTQWSQELRDIHTSMYDDWKGGQETEIDYLNGYIVDQGAAHRIPTPVNRTLWALVKALTAGNDDKKHTAQVSVVGDVLQESSFHMESLQTFPSDHQVSDVPGLSPGIAVRGIRVKA